MVACSESFSANPTSLSLSLYLTCPCLSWFRLFTLEFWTPLVWPCVDARKALLICWLLQKQTRLLVRLQLCMMESEAGTLVSTGSRMYTC